MGRDTNLKPGSVIREAEMGDASDDVLSLDFVIQRIGSSGDLIKKSPVRLEQNHVVNYFYQQRKVT